jgi:hypothetical protein
MANQWATSLVSKKFLIVQYFIHLGGIYSSTTQPPGAIVGCVEGLTLSMGYVIVVVVFNTLGRITSSIGHPPESIMELKK